VWVFRRSFINFRCIATERNVLFVHQHLFRMFPPHGREKNALARRTAPVAALLCLLVLGGLPGEAFSQRISRSVDPLFVNETARRAFFDGYAVGAHVSYRGDRSFAGDGVPAPVVDPLGVSFSFDYQVGSNMDVGAIVDAVGSTSGRTLSVSWLTLKVYQTFENTDYAFRLAVDPASDGRMGFPQLDATFISTASYTAVLSSDFVAGMRRVRMGYEQWLPASQRSPATNETATGGFDLVYGRAMGWEAHTGFGLNFHFDPAASNVFVALMGDGGEMQLMEVARRQRDDSETAAPMQRTIRGATIWVRTGIEYNRPAYQVTPFLTVPLHQWSTGDGMDFRSNLGLRFVLR
jgi:hypothetical protein